MLIFLQRIDRRVPSAPLGKASSRVPLGGVHKPLDDPPMRITGLDRLHITAMRIGYAPCSSVSPYPCPRYVGFGAWVFRVGEVVGVSHIPQGYRGGITRSSG